MSNTLIDLDVSAPWEPPEEPPPWRLRRFLTLPLVALAALGLPAAERLGARLEPVHSIGTQVQHAVAANRQLYVVSQRGDGLHLEVRGLRDGAVRWTLPVRSPYVAFADDETVLVPSEDVFRSGATSKGQRHRYRIDAHDAATGHRLWHRDDVTVVGVTGDLVIVEDVGATPEPVWDGPPPGPGTDGRNGPPEPPAAQRLLGLTRDTGHEAWATTVPAGTTTTFRYDQYDEARPAMPPLVELDADGSMRTRDMATGQVQVHGRLDLAAARTASLRISGVDLIGERVVVHEAGQVGATVHDLTTGRLLWRLAPRPDGSYLGRCGALLCLQGARGLWGIDPDTGRMLWHLDRWSEVRWTDHRHMIVTGAAHHSGGGRRPPGMVVAEPGTGRIMRIIDRWRPLTRLADGRMVVWDEGAGTDALIALLDPATGGVRVIGRAEGWLGEQAGCSAGGGFLMCKHGTSVLVWRLPPNIAR